MVLEVNVLHVSVAENTLFVAGFLDPGSKEQLHITECAEIVFDFQEGKQKQDDKALLETPAPPSTAQASSAGIASFPASSIFAPEVTSVEPAPSTPVADPSVFRVGGWSLRPARYDMAVTGEVCMTVRPRGDVSAWAVSDLPPSTRISALTNLADLCEVPWDAPDVSSFANETNSFGFANDSSISVCHCIV